MKKTIVFVLALAILVVALPAQARERHRHNDRGQQYYQQGYFGSPFQRGMANSTSYLLGPLAELRAMTAYGILNPRPVVVESYQDSVYETVKPGDCVKQARKAKLDQDHFLAAMAICEHQPVPVLPEPPVATPAPQTHKPSTVTVKNRAGETVCVNGVKRKAGESFDIDPASTPVIRILKGGVCGKADLVWTNHQTSLDLVCIRKVR